MIDDTLSQLDARIRQATHLDPETRAALESLVADLRREVGKLDDAEQAESIAAYTDSITREALRAEKDDDLLRHTMEGVDKSVRRFEASHPGLITVVNNICHHLSNLGI